MHSWVGPKNTRLFAQKKTPLGPFHNDPNEGCIPNRETTGPGTLLGQARRYPRYVGAPSSAMDSAACSDPRSGGASSVVTMIQGVIPPY